MGKKPITICAVLVTLLFFTGNVYSASSSKTKSHHTVRKISKKHRSSAANVKEAKGQPTATMRQGKPLVLEHGSPNKNSRLKNAKRPKRSTGGQEVEVAVSTLPELDKDNDEYIEYKLKPGETLEKIAERFNIDKQEIIDLNGVGKRRPRTGSIVFIPKTETETDDIPIVLNDRPQKPWKSEEERGILVNVAKSFAGAPYRYGGDSVRGLDCSAFVRKMYDIFGTQLPRSAREQFCAGPKVDKEDLVTGDLVFFRTKRYANYPTHVGIYIGNNMFIHASSLLGRGVKVDRLSDAYFTKTYTGAVRVKAPPLSDRSDTNSASLRNSDNS
jgi:peptidoglycan DL-endopeptidase LytE